MNRFTVVLLCGLSATAQTINVRGMITNEDGDPVSGAVATLLGLDLKDTTGADGAYAITQATSVRADRHTTVPGRVTIDGNQLEFKLFKSSSLTIEVFDIKSNLLTSEKKDGVEPGTHHWGFSRQHLADQLLIVRASIDNTVSTFSYMPLSGRYSGNSDIKSTVFNNSFSAKAVAGIADTLEVRAAGYSTKFIAVESYDTSINVTLNPADKWGGLKNPPRRSAGCGKVAAIKSGRQNIRSGGRDRTYLIDIPENYDPDTPYRLFYASHGLGGEDVHVAEWWNYFGLKTQAEATDEPAIFIAPQAIDAWGESDHALFDDITDYVEDCLCVDTTREFVLGMSFGGMITYSLSTNHQKKIRACVALAPANYNMWFPNPKISEPIAWMQTTGMSDNTCPWDIGNSRGSKYIALEKAADNGCTVPDDIRTWQRSDSARHLIVDLEGCMEGYPVKVCTFDGGHIQFPWEGGNGDNLDRTWVPGEAWKFFSQF